MNTPRLLSMKEAAAELGIHPKTASEIVKARGIKTVPLPYNGNGKGINEAAMKSLRDALANPTRRKRNAVSA